MSPRKRRRENRREIKRQNKENTQDRGVQQKEPSKYQIKKSLTPIKGRNCNQNKLINSIRTRPLTFAVGPAGTGKTFICGAEAVDSYLSGEVKKIVITRPVQEAEEKLGFLPGSKEEKFAPYFQPFREVLDERLGKSHVDNLLKNGSVEVAPLAYMRGRTFKNSMVILDEAQNTTPGQMKLFLTRLGENCKVCVNGDLSQKDIPGVSGLQDVQRKLKPSKYIGWINFSEEDVVRSPLVKSIVEAYRETSVVL